MELREEIQSFLRKEILGEQDLVESKSVDSWWNKLSAKQKSKLSSILGLAKGKDKRMYAKLDAASQDEVASYYRKHKGKVESVEDGDALEEGTQPPKNVSDFSAWRKRQNALKTAKVTIEDAVKRLPFTGNFNGNFKWQT